MKKILVTSNDIKASESVEIVKVAESEIASTAEFYASFEDNQVAVESMLTARSLGIFSYKNDDFKSSKSYDFFSDAPAWLQAKHKKQVISATKVNQKIKTIKLSSIEELNVDHLQKEGGVYLFKIPTGHGKSTKIATPSFSTSIQNAKKATLIAPLVSICSGFHRQAEEQTTQKIAYYRSIKSEDMNRLGVVTTINSSTKKSVQAMTSNSDLMIVEEIQKTLDTVAESKDLEGQRRSLCNQMKKAISETRTVFLLDADINDTLVDFVREAGREPILVEIETDHSDIRIDLADLGTTTSKIKKAVAAGKKISIATDSKSRAESLAEMLSGEPGVMVIHAENKGLEQQSKFLEDPNCNLDGVNILIYSPAMGSSISIEKDHFEEHFAIFTGVLTPLSCVQMLRRDRTARHHTVCVDAAKYVGYLEDIDTDCDLSVVLKIREQNKYLRESICTSLKITLEHLKFEVAVAEVDGGAGAALGDLTRAAMKCKENKIAAILEASIINAKQAKNMLMRDDLTAEQIAKRDATLTLELCGEVSRSAIDFRKYGGERAVELHKIARMSVEECIKHDGKHKVDSIESASYEMTNKLINRFLELGSSFTAEESVTILGSMRKCASWNKLNIVHLNKSGSLSESVAIKKAAKIYRKLGYKARIKNGVCTLIASETSDKFIDFNAPVSHESCAA